MSDILTSCACVCRAQEKMSLVRDPDPYPVSGIVGPATLADPQERLRKLLLAGARENQRRGAARGAAPTGLARQPMTAPLPVTLVVKIDPRTKHVDRYEGTLMAYANEIHPTRGRAMQAKYNELLEDAGKHCAHTTPAQVLDHMASSELSFSLWKQIFDAGMDMPVMVQPSELAPSDGAHRLKLDLATLRTALA